MSDATPAHPLIESYQLVVVPGVYDVMSAKMAERAGFHSVVLTGYGFAAAHLGEPDFGLFTATEILDCARRIRAACPNLGLVVDTDTGHGGPLNVQKIVRELVGMGARGMLLEDQTWPKRCGHMRGKDVIPAEEHAQKIRAAVEARGSAMLVITARTDALFSYGVDEAIRRAKLYKQAGADVLFVEGPRTKEDMRAICAELPPPLALNLIEGGDTPIVSLEEAKELGYFSVGFVLSGLYAAARALETTYRAIRQQGTTAGVDMMDFAEFGRFVGYEQRLEDDARFKVKG